MRVERRGPAFQPKTPVNRQREEPASEAKPYAISRQLVYDAYRCVRAKRGAAGVDGMSLAAFEKDLGRNLYKIWNRMSSGSYHPPPVRRVEIAKDNGGTRPLGIPTIADRVAQTVAKMVLEPLVEPCFHPGSYGYRPNRSALDAVGMARQRCWRYNWAIDLDIKGFFEALPHDLIERAVAHHTDLAWVRLYVSRWLRASVELPDGTRLERTQGTPQGGVISPLLANLFLHYAFDLWMQRKHPDTRFERYADDVIVHCRSKEEACSVLEAIRERLAQCGLELHSKKTGIVCCKTDGQPRKNERVSFDFLGYTFQPRRARNRRGQHFVSFLPAISAKAAKAIRKTIRDWRIGSTRNNQSLEDLARLVNPVVRGWLNYYGRFYRSKCVQVLKHLNLAIAHWARRKYKRLRCRKRASRHWLRRIAQRDTNLFDLWKLGIRP